MERGPDQTIAAHSIVSAEKIGSVQFWHTASFKYQWLRDTLLESEIDGLDHRRKEVIFAVCFLETFLYEWVREDILKNDYRELATFFPPDRKKGIFSKCKIVFNDLQKAGKVRQGPDWGAAPWQNFTKLVDLRDALIHAAVSRPLQDTDGLVPEKIHEISSFLKLKPGWALSVVVTLATEFYKAAPIDVPSWLLNPKLIPS